MSFESAQPKVNLGTVGKSLQGAYPTPYDATFAKKSGFGYGTGMEPYLSGQQANILVDRNRQPTKGIGQTSEAVTRADAGRMVKPAPLGIDVKMMQAALAANRIPLASLGFDPEKMNLDIKSDRSRLNVVGSYGANDDRMYVATEDSKGNPVSTPVHESIHRGLELLQKSPNAVELPKGFDEELLVRAMMARLGGDPEKDVGEISNKLRSEALDTYEARATNPLVSRPQRRYESSQKYSDLLDQINEAAQREIKRRRPERFAR